MLGTTRISVVGAAAFMAAVVLGGAVVSAQRPGSAARGPRAGLALRALDLTDAQREQIRQLTQQQREQARPLLDKVRAAQEARRQALEAVPFSEQQIRAAAQALAEVEADLAVQRARLQADIYALLTTEQQAQLEKMRAARDARIKERMGRFQQRGQPRARPQV